MNDSAAFERRLTNLFDRQRFFRDPALERLVAETESRCPGGQALSDEELDLVSAAGEVSEIKIIHQIIFPDSVPDRERNDP